MRDPPDSETSLSLERQGPVVLFDGVCNLCDASVNFLIDRDRHARLRFASLQSEAARALLRARAIELPAGDPESLMLVEGARVYSESEAVLRLSRHLPAPWRSSAALLVVPRALRDPVYRWIARNRYRWFGRSEVCRVPTPALRARFLS